MEFLAQIQEVPDAQSFSSLIDIILYVIGGLAIIFVSNLRELIDAVTDHWKALLHRRTERVMNETEELQLEQAKKRRHKAQLTKQEVETMIETNEKRSMIQ